MESRNVILLIATKNIINYLIRGVVNSDKSPPGYLRDGVVTLVGPRVLRKEVYRLIYQVCRGRISSFDSQLKPSKRFILID